jgi:hypothetical protein
MVVATLNPIRLAFWSLKELPTLWPNKLGLFRANMLATHLLHLTYNLSSRAVDKTYLIELFSDIPPFWGTKVTKRGLKPKRWDEIREKLNLTCQYWNNITDELLYSTNFKQRLLDISKNSSHLSSSSSPSSSDALTNNKQTEKKKYFCR